MKLEDCRKWLMMTSATVTLMQIITIDDSVESSSSEDHELIMMSRL